ncbi:MAG TPA: hypothetical protein VHU40_06440 [Polyangia bacterium]|nr:hypothetical protein [Polyangia bacterium]
MARRPAQPRPRTFVYRGGARVAGTVLACDASSGGDLLFVSNALGHLGGGETRPRTKALRAQILATPETLALLGAEGDRLRSRALTIGYGRPFGLGTLRLELLASGVLPGAAALFCEDGERRILYAGIARLGTPGHGALPAAMRAAHALCIDATFGHPRFRFVSRGEATANVLAFARDARDAGHPAVVLATALGPAQDLALALAAHGWKLRGHRTVVDAAAAYKRAGIDAAAIARFSGKLGRDEVLLWPATDRHAAPVKRLADARTAWVSGWAADAEAVAQVGVDLPVPYSHCPDFEGLLAYVSATGAREVAVMNGFAENFAAALRGKVADAYVIGPPRQIALFGGGA